MEPAEEKTLSIGEEDAGTANIRAATAVSFGKSYFLLFQNGKTSSTTLQFKYSNSSVVAVFVSLTL
jgi:hypothetical protein